MIEEVKTIKRSISLQPSDIAKTDLMASLLHVYGKRCSFSQLIQVAIKAAPEEPEALMRAVKACEQADRRRSE